MGGHVFKIGYVNITCLLLLWGWVFSIVSGFGGHVMILFLIGKFWATDEVSGMAQGDFHEFLDANSKVGPFQNVNLVWTQLESRTIKINVDAAVSTRSRTVGNGALPQLRRLLLFIGLKIHWVSLESHAEAIVRNCIHLKDPPVDVVVPIQDCLVLNESFNSCEFFFLPNVRIILLIGKSNQYIKGGHRPHKEKQKGGGGGRGYFTSSYCILGPHVRHRVATSPHKTHLQFFKTTPQSVYI
ncbi:hypothetical protein RHMOL_Rhmol09G0091400 [Rhododendron molle]|uniref:Uncharacterized protein n=1 Tax=Rhododendron molle TaxID=49168 RepID=A0ACC0MBH5_RHOML|nr:hypothetical protein RHMOL_Rhmol09G0091400 [Rhododendron molle]